MSCSPVVGGPIGIERQHEHLDRLERLPGLQRVLQAAESPAELLSRAVDIVDALLDFDRAIVLVAREGTLATANSLPVSDARSDRLRRMALVGPVPIAGALPEELGAGSLTHARIGEILELEEFVVCPLHVGERGFGVLVVDRAHGAADLLERAELAAVAAAVSFALEHVTFRSRLIHLRTDLKYLAASGQGLMSEVFADPSMPFERRHLGGFGSDFGQNGGSADGQPLFVGRERDVLELLIDGRSNREIAHRLMVSPETVKDYVTRIMRKLDASNRVEAVSRYLRIAHASGQ